MRGLGEEDDGDTEGTAEWVARMRQLQKEKDQAAKRVCVWGGVMCVCVCVRACVRACMRACVWCVGGGSDRMGKVSKPLEKC